MKAKRGTFKGYPYLQKLWSNINQRCYKEYSKSYKYYGAKGIKNKLHPKNLIFMWKRDNGFELKQPSLDRKDSKKNYTLRNCRFIEFKLNQLEGLKKCHRPEAYFPSPARIAGWKRTRRPKIFIEINCQRCGILFKFKKSTYFLKRQFCGKTCAAYGREQMKRKLI